MSSGWLKENAHSEEEEEEMHSSDEEDDSSTSSKEHLDEADRQVCEIQLTDSPPHGGVYRHKHKTFAA